MNKYSWVSKLFQCLSACSMITAILALFLLAFITSVFFVPADKFIYIIINPFWAILVGTYLTWMYFRHDKVLDLYNVFYNDLLEARQTVDTWTVNKKHEDFESLYLKLVAKRKGPPTELDKADQESYYNTLKFAMFMQHLAVLQEKKFCRAHLMVDPNLFDKTFRPNIAAYYLKLWTFLSHRMQFQGDHHKDFYLSFSNIALNYLEAYAADQLKEIESQNRSKEKIREFLKGNQDLSFSIAQRVAQEKCPPERGFINIFIGEMFKKHLPSQ